MSAEYECENCGRDAHMLLGGECLRKCSESVPVDELRGLIDDWRWGIEAAAGSAGHDKAAEVASQCADDLEELVGDE